jgi:hypothetical protein
MSVFPKIQTAIPQRRFQYGDFTVTVLGEIESGDARDYRFVAAFVKEGEAQPRLFVVSEHLPPGERSQGSHALRVINSAMDQVMDVDGRWARLPDFTDQALQLGSQILGLEQETAYPLM